ncbi:MAG: type II secretion system protein GspN [Bacteriovoracaceae bacterium]|nr:type II secretion system protein GspN [Bacteriovoracaceae bacterium]
MSENTDSTEDKIYKLDGISIPKWIIILFVVMFLGFFLNFPITNVIKSQVKKAIASARTCPISYDSIDVEYFFFPKIILKNPTIPGVCFRNQGNDIKLKELMVKLWFPSFLPPGIRFHIPFKYKKTSIDIYPTVTFGKIHINIKESKVDGKFLEILSGKLKNLKGEFEINAITNIDKKGPVDGEFLIKSKNLVIGPQSVSGLTIPNLPLKNVLIKAELERPKLSILDVIVGDEKSPLKANLKGEIKLNNKHFPSSSLDIDGNVFFSQDFLSSFSILNLFLAGKKTDKDGSYPIKVQGTFMRPSPSIK